MDKIGNKIIAINTWNSFYFLQIPNWCLELHCL